MRKLILTCSCSGQDKKALEAYSLLFPDSSIPEVVRGRDHVYKLYQETKNDHIKALSRLNGRYSYYLELEGNDIIKEIDLITGKRVR